jgi:enediyne biosynthesis protein E4
MLMILLLMVEIPLSLRGMAQAVPGGPPSQMPGNSSPPVPQGGSATVGVFAPVKDAEMRPITAGGFVKDGPVIFKDIAEEAGLSGWHHTMGASQKKLHPGDDWFGRGVTGL